MATPDTTTPPTADTDNWEDASLAAPRQEAGEVIARESEQADDAAPARPGDQADHAADLEAAAERQAAAGQPPAAAP